MWPSDVTIKATNRILVHFRRKSARTMLTGAAHARQIASSTAGGSVAR